MLLCVAVCCSVVQCVAVCCRVLQCVAVSLISHRQYVNMGWLRFVGSLKLWVSFAKEPYKRKDILQKKPVILRSLLIVATPYVKIFNGIENLRGYRNTVQKTATHYNALQHTARHCQTLQHSATHYNARQHTATHFNTLQHSATRGNSVQHT